MSYDDQLRIVPTRQAVGRVLGHDVTRIVPGKEKGPAFRKGHIIQERDIPVFLDIGKAHVYVLDLKPGFLHEDDAARRIAHAAVGPGLRTSSPSEGRINLIAGASGLLKIDTDALQRLNAIRDIVFATLHTDQRVDADQPVAGTRIIPLIIAERVIEAAEAVCAEHRPLIQVKPFFSKRIGMVTTGSEVYHGRIEDRFGPVVMEKFRTLGSRVFRQIIVDDDLKRTVAAIHALIAEDAQMIVLTGGMSVDPDDRTPAAIRACGAEIISYGAPTFPGAMFMLADLNGIPLVGLPGCVMYHQTSIFDLVIPRLLAGERVAREEIVALGHGGFCSGCGECRYPKCAFGK